MAQLFARDSPGFVLGVGISFGLPLHISWRISTSARKRNLMVHDVSFPAVRISCLTQEFIFDCGAPLDPTA
jgi:hypothetical protein